MHEPSIVSLFDNRTPDRPLIAVVFRSATKADLLGGCFQTPGPLRRGIFFLTYHLEFDQITEISGAVGEPPCDRSIGAFDHHRSPRQGDSHQGPAWMVACGCMHDRPVPNRRYSQTQVHVGGQDGSVAAAQAFGRLAHFAANSPVVAADFEFTIEHMAPIQPSQLGSIELWIELLVVISTTSGGLRGCLLGRL